MLIKVAAAATVLAILQPGAYVLGVFGPDSLIAAAQPDPNAQPAQPNKPASPAARPEIKTSDDLLAALEEADAGIKSLEGDLRYDKVFGIAGDRQVRTGKLWFVDRRDQNAGKPGGRKFAIRFDKLQVGPRVQDEQKIMVFDGEWLFEKLPAQKEMIKRRVVAHGEAFDPLKIGEGPFPLPIGQKREDILARFEAQLLSTEENLTPNDPAELDVMKKFIAGSYQLKLTPRREGEVDFTEVRLWYRPDPATGQLLPRMARTVNTQEDVSIVWLDKVMTNNPVLAEIFDAAAPAGWNVHVDDFTPENRR
jgi:hypothetical protein